MSKVSIEVLSDIISKTKSGEQGNVAVVSIEVLSDMRSRSSKHEFYEIKVKRIVEYNGKRYKVIVFVSHIEGMYDYSSDDALVIDFKFSDVWCDYEQGYREYNSPYEINE